MPDNIANPSNIATLIGGIMESKNRIKTKLLDLGLAAANDSLYDLSYEITDIANNGAISATVQEGTSYTIPAGYHNGGGVVTGIAGGGNYQLQAKGPITPTKSQQQITSDEGYYGLSGVTIDPIPDAYQDVSSVTAQASQVLATKIFVNSAGNVVTGTMANNGAVNQTISVATPSYTIPSGYHNGSGKVSIVTETKTITPSTSTQDITPTSGKVLSKVTVNAMAPGTFSASDEFSINPTVAVNNSGVVSVTYSSNINTTPVQTAGYFDATASYKPTISVNSSLQLSTQAATTITPTKSEQTAVAAGKYTTGIVKVGAIPSAYQDVTGVTAVASQVLEGIYFVNAQGSRILGSMPNHGKIIFTPTAENPEPLFVGGFYEGSSEIKPLHESISVTPSTTAFSAAHPSGYFIDYVNVAAIPSAYQDVTGVTAAASQVLAGTSYVTSDGTLTAGTMTNRGAVSKTLDATSGNQTYTIQSGYHNGSGSVSITLETKSATPSTVSQDITPTNGKVLSKVTVAAIPSAYQDVTQVTATAADVVASKKFVSATGSVVTGTMVDRGTISTQTLSTSTTSYTIPAGKHSGSGKVQIVLEEKSATPSTSAQNVIPTSGKVLSKVTVAAIPTAYRDVTGVTATASQVLNGASYVTAAGVLTAGTMANVGAQVSAIDGLTVASKLITQGYHDGTGYIYLTNDIEIALSSI